MRALSDLPNETAWMVVTTNSVHIPGDQRSIDAPGHGYPSHTETHPSIDTFTDEEALRDKIATLLYPKFGYRKEFRVFKIEPVNVTPTVSIDLGGS